MKKMGSIAAMVAILSFFAMQFMHAAVLDVMHTHTVDEITASLDHHDVAPLGHNHSGDDEHETGPLHGALHDHHHISSGFANYPLFVEAPAGDGIPANSISNYGHNLIPPVPPPLS